MFWWKKCKIADKSLLFWSPVSFFWNLFSGGVFQSPFLKKKYCIFATTNLIFLGFHIGAAALVCSVQAETPGGDHLLSCSPLQMLCISCTPTDHHLANLPRIIQPGNENELWIWAHFTFKPPPLSAYLHLYPCFYLLHQHQSATAYLRVNCTMCIQTDISHECWAFWLFYCTIHYS